MKLRTLTLGILSAGLLAAGTVSAQDFKIIPEGHQGGVCVIMNGHRVATNGDLRFEATPGQWQPVPAAEKLLN